MKQIFVCFLLIFYFSTGKFWGKNGKIRSEFSWKKICFALDFLTARPLTMTQHKLSRTENIQNNINNDSPKEENQRKYSIFRHPTSIQLLSGFSVHMCMFLACC